MTGRDRGAEPFLASSSPVVVLDGAGRVRALNAAAEATFGVEAEEVVGADAARLFAVESLDDGPPPDPSGRLDAVGSWSGPVGQHLADGTRRTGTAFFLRVPDPDGGDEQLTYVFLDPSDDATPEDAATADGPRPAPRPQARFERLFEHLPEALLIQELEGRILDVNAAAADLYGYERWELIGKDGRDITAGLDEGTIAERLRLLRERGWLVGSSVGLRADGRTFPQEVTIALDSMGGRPVAFILARDLSDRHRLEAGLVGLSDLARLHGSEGTMADLSARAMNLARRTLDADRAAICAFDGDESVEWLAHHRMERFIAATVDLRPDQIPWLRRSRSTGRAELIDRRAPDHVRTAVSAAADELGIAAFAIIPVRFGEEQTGALGLIWSGDPPDLARDEELLATIGRLIGLALGNLRLRDTLIARQRALDESEERYRTLFHDAPQPLLIEDWEGTILNANRAATVLYGRARRDLIGRRADEVAVLDREERQRVSRVLRRERHGVFGGWGIRADGSRFRQEVEIVVTTFRGEESLVLLIRDTTERERMQAELLQAQKMEALGQLISGVAHELNNPLSAIVAFSQLMQRDGRLPADLHRDAELLMREAERTRSIVQNLLDFARQRRPERRPTSLRELVGRTLELQSYALGGGRIEADVDVPADLPPVDVDPAQMQQVLLNLTLNAIQAITGDRGTGRITISAEPADAAARVVRLRLSDDGPGVRDEVRPRLFEPFFTTKEVGEGTGLGLSVSYGIVTSHGGRLWYEPNDGRGATFVVEMPLAEPTPTDAADVAEPPPAADEPPRRRRGVVLAVDDEPALRILLSRALGRVGHEVTVAESGEEALRILDELTFDVMLVDHRMRGMDGIELIERAVERRPQLATRTVVMSGDTLNPRLATFAQGRGLRMLPKPFDVEAVTALVDELLASDDPPA